MQAQIGMNPLAPFSNEPALQAGSRRFEPGTAHRPIEPNLFDQVGAHPDLSATTAQPPTTKRCPNCGWSKPLDAFHQSSRSRDGRQSWCRDCNKQESAARYRANPDGQRRQNERLRRRNRAFIQSYLAEHPCLDCGEADPVVLEFDHLRDKDRCISDLVFRMVSLARLRAEIEKCEVVCANCHRRRTASRRNEVEPLQLKAAS